jgi:acetyl esterase/lipase
MANFWTYGLVMLSLWVGLQHAAVAIDTTVKITPDVVYGHKDGLAMTLDVFTPTENPNGAGVIFIVSGGWYSQWTPPEKLHGMLKPLTDAGYTVFAVRHGSSPKYGIPDAVADVRRSVRFIRLNARQFGISPARLGVFGISAGGHLSLTLGTTGDDGLIKDSDPVNRVSDRVQAVVAFVAPTDLTIMVREAKDRLPAYNRFPALDLDLASAKRLSPLLHVSADDAPTLLLAGAKDDLVPIAHSQKIKAAFDQTQVPSRLMEFPEAGHGLPPADMKQAVEEMLNWFNKHLAPPAS